MRKVGLPSFMKRASPLVKMNRLNSFAMRWLGCMSLLVWGALSNCSVGCMADEEAGRFGAAEWQALINGDYDDSDLGDPRLRSAVISYLNSLSVAELQAGKLDGVGLLRGFSDYEEAASLLFDVELHRDELLRAVDVLGRVDSNLGANDFSSLFNLLRQRGVLHSKAVEEAVANRRDAGALNLSFGYYKKVVWSKWQKRGGDAGRIPWTTVFVDVAAASGNQDGTFLLLLSELTLQPSNWGRVDFGVLEKFVDDSTRKLPFGMPVALQSLVDYRKGVLDYEFDPMDHLDNREWYDAEFAWYVRAVKNISYRDKSLEDEAWREYVVKWAETFAVDEVVDWLVAKDGV